MSKYNSLWEYVQSNGDQSFKLTFEEIQSIAGTEKFSLVQIISRWLQSGNSRQEIK